MKSYSAPALPESLEEQLLRGETLTCGNYNVRLSRDRGEFFTVYVDGVSTRSFIPLPTAFRVIAHLRAAFTAEWSGR